MSRIHRYEGKDVVVEFELARCIHTGDCTRALPEVFDTQRRGRWVRPDGASRDDVVRVCDACPTGALRARDPDTGALLHPDLARNMVRIVRDGPLYVRGTMSVNGQEEPAFAAAFCRCGRSRNMPYCDESHRDGFSDNGHVILAGHFERLDAPAKGALDVRYRPGGSLKLAGPFELMDGDGRSSGWFARASFCRCGESQFKPFCDNTHRKTGFDA